jgi:hypothetical protein
MIISGTKKIKPNKIEDISKFVDIAGETQFKNIYKNVQEEIKDKIITKLLSKLERQNKQIEEYKQEIISLKNDIVYLLKRIILSKNEQKQFNHNSIKKININTLIKKSISSNNSPFNTSSQKLLSNCFNHIENNNTNNNINHKAIIDISSANINNINDNTNNDIDTKIANYLNSIYKRNFSKNETNINDYYSLNKKETLYDEIFQKKNNAKIEERYTGTEPCIKKNNYIKIKKYQRNISTSNSNSLNKLPTDNFHKTESHKNLSSSMMNFKNKNNSKNVFNIDSKKADRYIKYEDNINHNNITDNAINAISVIKRKKSGNKLPKTKNRNDELSKDNSPLNNYNSFKTKSQYNGIYTIIDENKIEPKNYIKVNNLYHYKQINRSPFITKKL